MPKYRRMLNNLNEPYMRSLMALIETQSRETLFNWAYAYTMEHILPIYESEVPQDSRPRAALCAAYGYVNGDIKLTQVKQLVNQCTMAAREAEQNPIAQAAARTCAQAAGITYTPTHSLGIALYGALAIAYHRLGLDKSWKEYETFAAAECAKMESALHAIAIKNDPNPAKINWNC